MKSEYFILLPNNICNSLQSFATEEMNQRNILPINKNANFRSYRKCHSLTSHERQKQRYSSQSWPTLYNLDETFQLSEK